MRISKKIIIYCQLRDLTIFFGARPKFFKNSKTGKKIFLAKTEKYVSYDIE
jgi:hypothetical protein